MPSVPEPGGERPVEPAFAPVADDPALPRVLIVGDSISIGYTRPVRTLLAGRANVHRIPENGGPTSNGVARLDAWLGAGPWAVIHFNFGLHDLKVMDGGGVPQVPPDRYEANLHAIVRRLERTGASLIWATTTPVPAGPQAPMRRASDQPAYRAAADRVMCEHGVAVNDLHAHVLPRISEWQRPNDVHFTDAGSAALAERVAAAIGAALARLAGVPVARTRP